MECKSPKRKDLTRLGGAFKPLFLIFFNKMNDLDVRIDDFKSMCCPFGYLDMKAAIDFYLRAGKNENDLFDNVKEFSESINAKFEDVDVVYVAYDTVLNETRNEIDDVMDVDFMNFENEIYTQGNFIATQYNFHDEFLDELRDKLKNATEKQKKQLLSNESVALFFEEIGFEF